jgi:serine/threonine-protein phosphatase 4 regulatory subunit 1
MDEDAIAGDDFDQEDTKAPSPAPLLMSTTPVPPWDIGVPTTLNVSDEGSSVTLVDEGDLLPLNTAIMDVTFDDEGLNTLERIFLLSRSEYAFHRAYVARVLGDLLGDVDPCESVEYVLPLISAFSLDEDETVKEAFAADLHRILWYFFSVCCPGSRLPY